MRNPFTARGSTCRAWRPAERREDHPFSHDPGTCRLCWQPCFAARRPGTSFCEDCWLRLATHRSVAVRSAVVSREDIPLEVLQDMTDDMDAPVSFAARDRIARFTADQIEDSGTDQMGSTR